jgi:hypothetical protein
MLKKTLSAIPIVRYFHDVHKTNTFWADCVRMSTYLFVCFNSRTTRQILIKFSRLWMLCY